MSHRPSSPEESPHACWWLWDPVPPNAACSQATSASCVFPPRISTSLQTDLAPSYMLGEMSRTCYFWPVFLMFFFIGPHADVCSQTTSGYCSLGPINSAGRVNKRQQIWIWSVRCCQELPALAVGALVSIWSCAKPDLLAAVCTASGWKTRTLCAPPKMLVMSKNTVEKYLRDLAGCGPADSALTALLPGGSPDPLQCSEDPTATQKSFFSSPQSHAVGRPSEPGIYGAVAKLGCTAMLRAGENVLQDGWSCE